MSQVQPKQPARIIGSEGEAIDVARELAAVFRPGSSQRDGERQLPCAELRALSPPVWAR